MKKYFLRYLVLWLPAFLAALLFNNSGLPSIVLQLFLGVAMLVGWAVNTGMAARLYPRAAMALVLFYFGASLIAVRFHYTGQLRRLFGAHSVTAAGIFSYVPLDVFLQKILYFNIRHEVYIIVGITLLCLFGWLMGMLYRWHNPDPYRPRIKR